MLLREGALGGVGDPMGDMLGRHRMFLLYSLPCRPEEKKTLPGSYG